MIRRARAAVGSLLLAEDDRAAVSFPPSAVSSSFDDAGVVEEEEYEEEREDDALGDGVEEDGPASAPPPIIAEGRAEQTSRPAAAASMRTFGLGPPPDAKRWSGGASAESAEGSPATSVLSPSPSPPALATLERLSMYALLLGEEGVVALSTAVPSLTRASPKRGPSALLLSLLLRWYGEQSSSSDASAEDDTICADRSRCRASSLHVLALWSRCMATFVCFNSVVPACCFFPSNLHPLVVFVAFVGIRSALGIVGRTKRISVT